MALGKKVKEQAAPEVPEQAFPYSEIVIDSKIYKLCFTFRALARAETRINKDGRKINLVASLPPEITGENTLVLFACALGHYHPEITFDQACEMLTLPYIRLATVILIDAWEAAMPKPDPAAVVPTPASLSTNETAG